MCSELLWCFGSEKKIRRNDQMPVDSELMMWNIFPLRIVDFIWLVEMALVLPKRDGWPVLTSFWNRRPTRNASQNVLAERFRLNLLNEFEISSDSRLRKSLSYIREKKFFFFRYLESFIKKKQTVKAWSLEIGEFFGTPKTCTENAWAYTKGMAKMIVGSWNLTQINNCSFFQLL